MGPEGRGRAQVELVAREGVGDEHEAALRLASGCVAVHRREGLTGRDGGAGVRSKVVASRDDMGSGVVVAVDSLHFRVWRLDAADYTS